MYTRFHGVLYERLTTLSNVEKVFFMRNLTLLSTLCNYHFHSCSHICSYLVILLLSIYPYLNGIQYQIESITTSFAYKNKYVSCMAKCHSFFESNFKFFSGVQLQEYLRYSGSQSSGRGPRLEGDTRLPMWVVALSQLHNMVKFTLKMNRGKQLKQLK